MPDQADLLRERMDRTHAAPLLRMRHGHARTVVVASGKGGVGKSQLAVNLGVALALSDHPVCVLDAHTGLGSVDLLCGLNGYWNLAHVAAGGRRLADVCLAGPGGVRILTGASALVEPAGAPPIRAEAIRELETLAAECDYLIVDTSPGPSSVNRRFCDAADLVLVVTTPEPTALAAAYATCRSLAAGGPRLAPGSGPVAPPAALVVNRTTSEQQGADIAERVRRTVRQFVNGKLAAAGSIPDDDAVLEASFRRQPFVIAAPQAPAAAGVRALAAWLVDHLETVRSGGPASFFARLLEAGADAKAA